MTVSLNARAFDHAKKLIKDGRYVLDDRDAWSEHRPSAKQENEFIAKHDIGEYARWFLGIDKRRTRTRRPGTNSRTATFRGCTVVGALGRVTRRPQKYFDVELAIAHLHGMLDVVP
jgi:hypothetical protein